MQNTFYQYNYEFICNSIIEADHFSRFFIQIMLTSGL